MTTGSGRRIAGLHGTLHLNADGSYTYQSTANTSRRTPPTCSSTRSRTATATLSTTTLTINVANATVLAPADNDVTVNENALDTTVTRA